MLGSFDLASCDVWKVADVTVLQAEPGAMGQVPPAPIGICFLYLVVLDTPVSKRHDVFGIN